MDAFNQYFLDIVKNHYADANGRARRKEYWMFMLFSCVIAVALEIVGLIFASISSTLGIVFLVLLVIFALALLVPSICLVIRRLHDTGKSGWFILLGLVPLLGLVLLVFMLIDSTPGENMYGPNPKGVTA